MANGQEIMKRGNVCERKVGEGSGIHYSLHRDQRNKKKKWIKADSFNILFQKSLKYVP